MTEIKRKEMERVVRNKRERMKRKKAYEGDGSGDGSGDSIKPLGMVGGSKMSGEESPLGVCSLKIRPKTLSYSQITQAEFSYYKCVNTRGKTLYL